MTNSSNKPTMTTDNTREAFEAVRDNLPRNDDNYILSDAAFNAGWQAALDYERKSFASLEEHRAQSFELGCESERARMMPVLEQAREALRPVAESPTSRETIGVANDFDGDDIIYNARQALASINEVLKR